MQPIEQWPTAHYPRIAPIPRKTMSKRMITLLTLAGLMSLALLAGVATYALPATHRAVRGVSRLAVAPIAQSTFTASGTIEVDCATYCEGYDDLSVGAQACVYDAAGVLLATGEIDAQTSQTPGESIYHFQVVGIRNTGGPYFVEISHRGRIAFNQSDATSIQLSIGDGS